MRIEMESSDEDTGVTFVKPVQAIEPHIEFCDSTAMMCKDVTK